MAGVASAVQIHIRRGDDLNARDTSGMTPLMLSAARNRPAICKLLLDAGADEGMLDPSGKTAFDIAFSAGAREILAVFESAKASVEASGESEQSAIAVALDVEKPLTPPSLEYVGTQHYPLSTQVVPDTAPAGREDYVDSEKSQEFDLHGWEPEEEKPPPAADLSVLEAFTVIQQAITEYVPIDSSADWDDVDAYLPETALPLVRTGDDERRERLRLLLLRALREGSVPQMEVDALSANNDRTSNPEAEALLRMVINDLGAEVDERFEYVNAAGDFRVFVKPEETPDEEEAVSDALAFIENLTSRHTEPLRIYQKEFQQHLLISAEQEVLLAQAMENALESALDALAAWPQGIGLTLDAGGMVVAGQRPLTWISCSPTEISSDPDSGLKGESDEDTPISDPVDEEENDESSNLDLSAGSHASDFSDALRRLADLPVDSLQQETGWHTVREMLSSLRLSRPFLLELADAADTQNPGSALQYAKAIKAYQCAREQMAAANLKLAFHIAKKYLYCGEPLDDLAQEANIGLLKAVDRFDWRRGFKFSTYASWWIRQQVSRYVADKCRTIRLPVHVHEKVQRLQREAQDFEAEAGRVPELYEIAARMNMPSHKVAALQRLSPVMLSIHELPVDELIAVEVRSDFVSPDPMDIVFESELHAVLDKMLTSLKIREEQVIRLRYGVGIQDSLTLDEIGKRYGLTRERIRQIETKAMRELRHPNRISAFISSVHGSAAIPEKRKEQSRSTRALSDDLLSSPEPEPSSMPSSVDNLFLQATELGAAIELDRKKHLEKFGVK